MSPLETNMDVGIALRKKIGGTVKYIYPLVRDVDVALTVIDDENDITTLQEKLEFNDDQISALQSADTELSNRISGIVNSQDGDALDSMKTHLGDSSDIGKSLSQDGQTISFSHKNSITSGTTSSSNGTLSPGGTITIPVVTFDNHGHITSTNSTTMTLSSSILTSIPTASSSTLGGIKVGDHMSVDSNNKLQLDIASTAQYGLVQLANSIETENSLLAATEGAVLSAINSAEEFATSEANRVYNAIMGGASDELLDTIKELADAISELGGVDEGITAALANKSDVGHTHNYASSSSAGGPADQLVVPTDNTNSLTVVGTRTMGSGDTHNVFTATGVTIQNNAVTATTFNGALSGNASTATKLATARTISVGSINNITFDGSSDISFPTANMGIVGTDVALTGYTKGSSSGAVAATDTVSAAIGKLENQVSAANTATTNAIAGITGSSITGGGSASKTIIGISQTNGVVTATTSDIAITSSQATLPTGYSAASSWSAPAAADSVTTAIGKLHKKVTDLDGKGTVTRVATGDGLTGGTITASGTLKANLKSYTKLTNDSAAATETSGRVYPVALDKTGYLAVNVPWTDSKPVTSVNSKTGAVSLTYSDVGAAASSHTHSPSDVGLGNVGNFKAVSTVANQELSSTEKDNARANIGAGTSSLTIGNTASTAAAGNHTHTTTIASDTGTSDLAMEAGTKYKISAGGTSFVFTTPPDNNTEYSSLSAASGGTDVSLVTTGEKYTWNSKTSNTGTVTRVATGDGLTGGTITASGTLKANLKSYTKLTNDSAAATETSGRVYPVALDKTGYLAVNVPWVNDNTEYSSLSAASGGTDVSLVTTGEKYTWNSKTSNTGTVTRVATGDGLTGGTITASGTLKANLKSYTKLTNDSAAATETSGRVYPVALDKTGYLAVNVPWTDNNTVYTHPTSGVTPGTYRSVAVDANGHVTGGSNPTSLSSYVTDMKVTSSATLGTGVDDTNVYQGIGYVGNLTKANWNYQQVDGALYKQTYSASWVHQIFGDYRTGQISVRGRNNGTWQNWRRVLDEINASTILGLGSLATKSSVSGSTSYTPAGSNTGGAVTLNTTNIYQITGVGSLPSCTFPTLSGGSYTKQTLTPASLVEDATLLASGVLKFTFSGGSISDGAVTFPTLSGGTFSQGTLPTRETATVATSVKTFTQPTFSGTAATISITAS